MKQEKRPASKVLIMALSAALALMMVLTGSFLFKNGEAAADSGESKLTFASAEESTETTVPSFAQSGQYTRAEIVAKCAPSVVGIEITKMSESSGYYSFGYGYGYGYGSGSGNQQEVSGAGSGVILTEDGYIATCAHVTEDATSIKVILQDGTEYTATLIGSEEKDDIAIIKIEATGLTPATVGDSDSLVVGEDVIAIGNSMGELLGTTTSGIISATKRTITVEDIEMELLQTDAAINSGNSGGGLFNADGALIGIVNAKVSSSGVEGLGFAIPINNVAEEIGDLLSYGYVTGRAYLGVYTQNVLAGQYRSGRNYTGGTRYVQVVEVVEGGAAEAAGIQAGDYILKVDDKEISDNSTLSDLIKEYNAGDTATITIRRNNVDSTVEVTFGEYVPEGTVKEQ